MENINKMIEQFQCPGCVCGSDIDCGRYNYDKEMQQCTGHVLGTSVGLNNSVALGLPRGFNKPGFDEEGRCKNTMNIRLWESGDPGWDNLNVPVWAMEQDGFLFVRTYMPRINMTAVDVIKGGKIDMCPDAIDVSAFVDKID